MLNGNPASIESVSSELEKLDSDHKATRHKLLEALAKEAAPYRRRRLELTRLLECLRAEARAFEPVAGESNG